MDYNVYNYFIGNYAQKPATKYDTHKSSELRSVMKNITKMTQSSPDLSGAPVSGEAGVCAQY